MLKLFSNFKVFVIGEWSIKAILGVNLFAGLDFACVIKIFEEDR